MMLVVQKFGGTSVGTVERIRAIADFLIKEQSEFQLTRNGQAKKVVAVVSAMAGETNRLVALANAITPLPWSREYDMLLAAGEQQSVALLALAINSRGGKACPLLAHQVGIKTDNFFSRARIREIHIDKIHQLLAEGIIPVIAGFQGVDDENNITTLGRGGSDTSAVAIAAALNADDCDIFTDVEGIYTTDPRVCSKARKLNEVCYEEMIEMASLGAKVLHIRSVELAAKYRIPLHVRSSFDLKPGTRIIEGKKHMEDILVSAVVSEDDVARITLNQVPNIPNSLPEIFGPVAQAGLVVDVIVQNLLQNGKLSISFTLNELELKRAEGVINERVKYLSNGIEIQFQSGLCKVSIVGVGMRNHPGVASKAFQVMADAGIGVILVSTSEIKVSMIIEKRHLKKAVDSLHFAFHLE